MLFLAIALLLLQATTVEGVITKPDGTEPLAGARVTLTGSKQFSTTTEEDGRFIIRNISPGDYTVSAESPRYGTAMLGQRRTGGPSSTVSIAAGQTISGLKISMFPTGAIAGRITTRNGEPSVQAFVRAFRYVYEDGQRTLTPVRTTTTNDLGEYRLFLLPAGQYFVEASKGLAGSGSIHDAMAADPSLHLETAAGADPQHSFMVRDSFTGGATIRRLLEDETIQEESWIPMFYPATTEPRDATPIDVSAGATMNGVNITIGPSPIRKVSGQVVGNGGAIVKLVALSGTNGFNAVFGSPANPSFEFKGIDPGSYAIYAEDGRNYTSAVIPVEVGNRDVDNIRLTLRPKITLTVRVILENSTTETNEPNPFADLAVILTQGNVELPIVTLPLKGTGIFGVNNVSPGQYQVQLRSLGPQGPEDSQTLFVKSARFGQTDVSNGITITDGTQDRLEIILTKEAGSVEGLVTEPGRAGAAGATVVLVPAVARKNMGLYKSAVADASGKFLLHGIPPGDYLLFAWNDVETGAWQNPEFLRPFEARGRRIQVSGTNRTEVQIPLISTP